MEITIDSILNELLDLDEFCVYDERGRRLQEAVKDTITGKHNMVKSYWITPKDALQFITHTINILPTGAIQAKDL